MSEGSGCFRQLRFLLWKNWLLKKRRAQGTLIEIAFPVIVVMLVLLIRWAVKIHDIEEQHLIDQTVVASGGIPLLLNSSLCGVTVPPNGYSKPVYRNTKQTLALAYNRPEDQAVAELMAASLRRQVIERMPAYEPFLCFNEDHELEMSLTRDEVEDYINQQMFTLFEGEKAMEAYVASQKGYGTNTNITTFTMAVVLDTAAPQWHYTMRANLSDSVWTGTAINNLQADYSDKIWKTDFTNHFVSVKHMIDSFIIEHVSGAPLNNFDAEFVPFPIAAHKQDNFAASLGNMLGLLLVLAFTWPFSRMVRNMVEEKEKKIREGMKMMGLHNSVFWWSWSLTYLVMYLISCIAVAVVCHPDVFPHSNAFIIFIFFFAFSLSLIALACLTSSFFDRAKTAGTMSFFVLLAGWMPYVAVADPQRAEGVKGLACLLSPVALALGSGNIMSYESAFIGVHNDNLNEVTDNFKMMTAIVMMFFDALLYGVLAWYFDAVMPKEFGTRLPWYFPVSPAYWKKTLCGSRGRAGGLGMEEALLPSGVRDEDDDDSFQHSPDVESVPPEMESRVGIKIRKLYKEFPSHTSEPFKAVNQLDLNMYQGQIFVLLGHNGAGKTTTINMLTGMLPVTSGSAKIFGRDITNQMDDIRTFLGVCPQHDTLFDTLSVKEHLMFFGRLKGLRESELMHAVNEAIVDVQLELETDKHSADLSGGQKRRLSLAIALLGRSKVVFLDEPTSGVDPFSRRAIWDLLNKKKEGRVIVLTTHFMDEADQLADRVGILHGGQLKCCGSTLFLKRKFGVGYNMTLTKSRGGAGCNAEEVQATLRRFVPEAEKLSDVGSELVYRLPLGASAAFPKLLANLDDNQARLGITNYGLSVTTMEEVFLKVASEDHPSSREVAEAEQSEEKAKELAGEQGEALLAGHASQSYFSRHFKALIAKRYNITKRDKKAGCCQIITPILLLSLGFYLLHIPPDANFPDFAMDLHPYNVPNFIAANQYLSPEIQKGLSSLYPDKNVLTLQRLSNATTPIDFSHDLLAYRLLNKEARYGALFQDEKWAHSQHYTVFSNITATHGLPTWQNIANSALLRELSGNANASIAVNSHPLPWTKREKQAIENFNGAFAAIIISLAFSFIPSSYAAFIVGERESKAKHLQMISGVSQTSYWLANYLWDVVSFLIPATICALIVLFYANPNFTGDNFPVVLLSFFLYGMAVIPFTYLCSFLFASHSTAQNVMILIYILGGVAMTITSVTLHYIDSTQHANDTYIRHIFRLLPNFCLGDVIFWMSIRSLELGEPKAKWSMDVSGYDLLYMFIQSFVYFGLTLLVEKLTSIPDFVALFKSDPKAEKQPVDRDVDVENEKRRIQSGGAANDLIRIEGLRKTYGPPARTAVNDLWYAIPAGECFGFLGVNGAGKTTTIKMLTGDVVPSEGDAWLGGFNIATQVPEVRRLMGYCPQFDALHELLTAEETLIMYGRFRGIPEHTLMPMVRFLIERLSLTKSAKRPAGTYSGGNKRKLSVAIALIGNPKVVFLDEPSTGMDPVSRRFMWDFISETMTNRAVILTTHSMEECEALCQRIGIISQGDLKCLGSSQHLKHRFGRGLQIDISTGAFSPDAARQFMQSEFKTAQELECYGNKIKYTVSHTEGRSLRDIFTTIEKCKNQYHIAEYSVGQTSLEQIFLTFAKAGEADKQETYHRLQGVRVDMNGESKTQNLRSPVN